MKSSAPNCKQCHQPIPLRSFRLPPNVCPNCGQVRDPHEEQSRRGCLVLVPVAIVVALAGGTGGWIVGQLLLPFVNDPLLDFRLACIMAFDGLYVVAMLHSRKSVEVRGPSLATTLTATAVFAFIGWKCGGGQGLPRMLLIGIANAIVAMPIALLALKLADRNSRRCDHVAEPSQSRHTGPHD